MEFEMGLAEDLNKLEAKDQLVIFSGDVGVRLGASQSASACSSSRSEEITHVVYLHVYYKYM
jgi:hypothetical protein